MASNTFTKIASSTVGSGGVSSIDFSSIPSTYTDLCLKVSARSDASAGRTYFCLRFNASSGASYNWRILWAYDSNSVDGNTGTNGTYQQAFAIPANTATSSTFSNSEIYIPNYAGSTNKSFSADSVAENNSTATWMVMMEAGLWANTSAINQITLYPGATPTGNFMQYTTATLYGIKNS